ncbi:MAG: hypothetical protein DHS20C09_11300 [marine bacterium B5-7]|nr:MAG: hypothetical protein DHS20C09_11300 [marine bacterium B5-7]
MSELVLTFDVDWAEDFVIEEVASKLIESGVRSTWFVTHESEAICRLKSRPDLFELGIHPNFLPGSTHGHDISSVLDHCLRIVPAAKVMRTHGLYQSTPLFVHVLCNTPIKIDSSLFLDHVAHVSPFVIWLFGHQLIRVPYVWEDDSEAMRPSPQWRIEEIMFGRTGPCVINFHPIHVVLNSSTLKAYEKLKERVRLEKSMTVQALNLFVNEGLGTRSMFDSALLYLKNSNGGQFLSDVSSTSF